VVALDPRNGDLLAMVSSPGFDPNDFSGGIAAEEWNALNRDPARPLLNRAVTGVYPPGSTFKVAIATMALDAGVVRPEETLRPCTGGYAMGNRVFHCWRPGGHGCLPMREAIAQSCDIYFYQLGQRVGLENMARYVRRWGITEKTGSGLSGEVRGLFPDSLWLDRQYGHSGWTRTVELNLAIGQGEVLVTPLGLATFVGGVANGGEIMTPRVWLRAVTPAGRLVKENAPHGHSMGVSREALAVVREGMAGAVAHGTARAAQLAGITVAGKTGTAQNPHGNDHAWFVGFAPAENPEIVVLALLEGGGHGGAVAAPIVARVMRAYFGLEAGGGT